MGFCFMPLTYVSVNFLFVVERSIFPDLALIVVLFLVLSVIAETADTTSIRARIVYHQIHADTSLLTFHHSK